MDPSESRIVKLPMPIRLIRRVDEAIAVGMGGFETRAELLNEAVETFLDELAYAEAPAEPQVKAQNGFVSFESTEIWPNVDGFSVGDGLAVVSRGPLLGLHNRDYVSIWALDRLSELARSGPVDLAEFLNTVTAEAWDFARNLEALQNQSDFRLTVLFPSNHSKKPSAERGFQAFAIGSASRVGSIVRAQGPLFLWNVVQVTQVSPMLVAPTSAGNDLLKRLEGISLRLPHSEELTTVFLDHLTKFAPEDHRAFMTVLRACADQPDRAALLRRVQESNPEWTEATGNSVAQGYVARSREWGLLGPKLEAGRYVLTARGRAAISKSSKIPTESELTND